MHAATAAHLERLEERRLARLLLLLRAAGRLQHGLRGFEPLRSWRGPRCRSCREAAGMPVGRAVGQQVPCQAERLHRLRGRHWLRWCCLGRGLRLLEGWQADWLRPLWPLLEACLWRGADRGQDAAQQGCWGGQAAAQTRCLLLQLRQQRLCTLQRAGIQQAAAHTQTMSATECDLPALRMHAPFGPAQLAVRMCSVKCEAGELLAAL